MILRVQFRVSRVFLRYELMPVAFLYNRRFVLGDENILSEVLSGLGYEIVSPMYQMYIKLKDFDVDKGLLADNSVRLVAASVERNTASEDIDFPCGIDSQNTIVTVIPEAELPDIASMEPNDSGAFHLSQRKFNDKYKIKMYTVRTTAIQQKCCKHVGGIANISAMITPTSGY